MYKRQVEILATMIRQDKNIKGIDETEHKIPQYADDTETMFEGDRNLFERAVKSLTHLGRDRVSSSMRGR